MSVSSMFAWQTSLWRLWSGQLAALPISRAYVLIGFHNSTRDGEEQGPRKIGSSFVEHAGSVRYHYSALGTRW